jgi:hypothetical protein
MPSSSPFTDYGPATYPPAAAGDQTDFSSFLSGFTDGLRNIVDTGRQVLDAGGNVVNAITPLFRNDAPRAGTTTNDRGTRTDSVAVAPPARPPTLGDFIASDSGKTLLIVGGVVLVFFLMKR